VSEQTLSLILIVTFAALAAGYDLRTGLIPDRLVVLGLIACALVRLTLPVLRGGVAAGAASLGVGLLGLVVCSIIPLVLVYLNSLGGGDLKLLAMLGFGAGPLVGMDVQLCAFVALLLYAPAQLAYRGTLGRSLRITGTLLLNPLRPKRLRAQPEQSQLTTFRFGPAIFVGTLLGAAMNWSGR
jgi:prepilin peptidase CpaA